MSPALSELDRCLIHRAVEDLILMTGDSIDRRAFDQLVHYFHPESRLYRPTMPDPLVGPQAIADSYRNNPSKRLNRHLVSNIRVHIDSATEARVDSYVTLYSSEDGDSICETFGAPLHRCLVGEFHDLCVKSNGGWRILERRAEFTLNMPVARSE